VTSVQHPPITVTSGPCRSVEAADGGERSGLSVTSFSSPWVPLSNSLGGGGAGVSSHGSGGGGGIEVGGGDGLGGGAKRSQATSRGRSPAGTVEAAEGGERSGLDATSLYSSRVPLSGSLEAVALSSAAMGAESEAGAVDSVVEPGDRRRPRAASAVSGGASMRTSTK
jgi:hypothetical protein